jgi:GNAT superfamily N-acetyltransferase
VEAARPATREDLPALHRLRARCLAELEGAHGGQLLARELAGAARTAPLDEAIGREDQGVWVGTVEGVPVGYVRASCRHPGEGPMLGTLEELFVEPAARGVGVGQALVEEALVWLGDRGCAGVDVAALPGDRATKSFLEGTGFRARLLVMHRTTP